MASRLRLFLKKRGSRRTGARLPGLVGEGALFVGLVAIGIFGLYWLIARVLLAEDADYGWWPWLAVLIPLALVGYGATGLVLLLWENVASTERRAAVVQKATEWELPGAQFKRAGMSLPSIPTSESITDSPGVRLNYRLPIDSAPGWVSFTMATVCILWNSFVAIFVVRFIYQADEVNWLLVWLMVPFVLAGLWTLAALGRQVLLSIAIGTTRLEVSHHPLVPGGTYRGFVSQSGRLHVRWFQVQLVCEEQAVYQQGTDTRRETCRVYRETAFSQRKFDIAPHQAFEVEFDFTVPPSAMHSFAAPHNGVAWMLVVRGRMARWGDFERRFHVYVYPVPVMQEAAVAPYSQTVGGQSR
jgi:hypothetical protein